MVAKTKAELQAEDTRQRVKKDSSKMSGNDQTSNRVIASQGVIQRSKKASAAQKKLLEEQKAREAKARAAGQTKKADKIAENIKVTQGKIDNAATRVQTANNISTKATNTKARDTASLAASTKQGQQQAVHNVSTDPTKLTPTAKTKNIDPNAKGTNVSNSTGQLQGKTPNTSVTTPKGAATASNPKQTKTSTVKADTISQGVKKATNAMKGVTGKVGKNATVNAAKGDLGKKSVAKAATMDPSKIQEVSAGERKVGDKEMVTAATDYNAPEINVDEAKKVEVGSAQGEVDERSIAKAATLDPNEAAQARVVQDKELSPEAQAKAYSMEKFSVDDGTLAEFKEGSIEAMDTVQGQLAELMRGFEGGEVPAWAAGSIRAASDAMAARGLGGSSMAGAAIVQASMEAAIPIATQDAQAYREMKLDNLNRQTQVSLANAAANQKVELTNLDNKQKVALQNSLQASNLQMQNLSNEQATVLANAQIKAAIQQTNLSNEQQTAITNAAKYAEINKINLNNAQQSLIQQAVSNTSIETANLSSRTQQAIAQAQVQAALEGKVLDNKQQAAVVNADRYAAAADLTFTAEESAKLHNSTMMQTIGLAELNAKSAATLQNAAQYAGMDMANLDNRMKANVQNATAFLSMNMANLSNKQQMEMFSQQSIVQGLFNDQAAKNVAKNLNMTEGNDADQFFANLQASVAMTNAAQKNAMRQFSSGETNDATQFAAELENNRQMFETANSVNIALANAAWRQNVQSTNTAAENQAVRDSTLAAYTMTSNMLDNVWQRERDLMSYAFQAFENKQDRDLELFLGEKTFDEYDKQRDAAEEDREATERGARDAMIYGAVKDVVGGFIL